MESSGEVAAMCEDGIKFLYSKGRMPQETFDKMKATYGEDVPSYDIKHCHSHFRCGRRSVEMAPISGITQPAIDEDTIHPVETAILEDHRSTVRHLAQYVKISVRSVDKIIHDHLHIQKPARWVPRPLTPFQKQGRVYCSKALLVMCQENQEDFLNRLIMQDEIWMERHRFLKSLRGIKRNLRTSTSRESTVA
ncbi:uncharacterized protein LOC119578419 [Penaeus monodon]|uniref:uncharacterized protein LOC119578419 n=1 Tax=Penaeus monodon TaxID=6687 RepID=UPI0018A7B253|nr:uncharacterized protein LOC119578419 [Penaeus monodon]